MNFSKIMNCFAYTKPGSCWSDHFQEVTRPCLVTMGCSPGEWPSPRLNGEAEAIHYIRTGLVSDPSASSDNSELDLRSTVSGLASFASMASTSTSTSTTTPMEQLVDLELKDIACGGNGSGTVAWILFSILAGANLLVLLFVGVLGLFGRLNDIAITPGPAKKRLAFFVRQAFSRLQIWVQLRLLTWILTRLRRWRSGAGNSQDVEMGQGGNRESAADIGEVEYIAHFIYGLLIALVMAEIELLEKNY